MTGMSPLVSPQIEVEDSLEAANQWFLERRLSDGLPIVPPTPERVRLMLGGTHRDPQEIIGHIPPNWAPATVEKIAINAVMAGCQPEYLPVVIAAVEAIAEPDFNLFGVQATTGYVGPALIVSGAIAQELEINSSTGCFGPGWRANATIGRTIRLLLLSVGGGIPGVMDRATFGWPGKYTFCFAEDDETNPWEPLRVERGFAPGDNTVSAAGINASIPVSSGGGLTGEEALEIIAGNIVGARGGGHLTVGGFGGGTPVLAISPDTASVIARSFRSKREVQRFLYERATLPLSEMPRGRVEGKSREEIREQSSNVTPDGLVHLADRPEDIVIVVCGGPGGHVVLLPCWTGKNTQVITKRILLKG